jgi:glyoxylase-like metal-dependent hydrolase (beta-lactamase superfamily II)
MIGAEDVVARQRSDFRAATADVEVKIRRDAGLTALDGAPVPDEELERAECVVIPQPGHTPGTLCLLYRNRFLFAGDHFAYSRLHCSIEASRLACWDDWERQTDSVRTLAELTKTGRIRFDWLLPSHGEWHHFVPDGGEAGAARSLVYLISGLALGGRGGRTARRAERQAREDAALVIL